MQNQHFSSLFEPSKPAWGIIMKKLSIDNPFFGFMDRLGDIVILNILFLICSVPIITMGASVSAMYQALREMEEDTYISAFKSFKAAFMSSLKKSIPVWLDGKEEIKTTAYHPVYVQEQGWVAAINLREGDTLETMEGHSMYHKNCEKKTRRASYCI